MKKLYVGNIPFSVSEEELSEHFARVGKVESVKLVVDRDTGRKKGFGFVEMSTDEEAQKTIEQLDGQELAGRQLRISLARPKEEGGGRGGFGGGGGRPGGGGGFRGGRGGGGGGPRRSRDD